MRLLFIASLMLCGALHAIVLLKDPVCGGIVVGRQAILTLKECISSSSELITPVKLKPTHFLMHTDDLVGLLIFPEPLPYEPIVLGGSRNNLQSQHIGQRVNIGNSVQSIESSITQISANHLWIASGISPVLVGSPLWSVSSPSRAYRAIGLMVDERTALKLDLYADFVNSYVRSPSRGSQKIVSLPAIAVSDRKPIVSLNAEIVGSQTHENPIEPTPETQSPTTEQPRSSTGPQSVGCACSQTGINLARAGFFRRLFGR